MLSQKRFFGTLIISLLKSRIVEDTNLFLVTLTPFGKLDEMNCSYSGMIHLDTACLITSQTATYPTDNVLRQRLVIAVMRWRNKHEITTEMALYAWL